MPHPSSVSMANSSSVLAKVDGSDPGTKLDDESLLEITLTPHLF